MLEKREGSRIEDETQSFEMVFTEKRELEKKLHKKGSLF